MAATPDKYYILSTGEDERTRVLKHGDTFAVFDRSGDICASGIGAQGLYFDGTRFLSHLLLSIDGQRPHLLGSTIRHDNVLLVVDLSNPDLLRSGRIETPRGDLHIVRHKLLWEGSCHESLLVTNYSRKAIRTSLSLCVDADFADIFEVRGTKRPRRGERLPTQVHDDNLVLSYRGLDGVLRETLIRAAPRALVSSDGLRFDVDLEPQACQSFFVTVTCGLEAARAAAPFVQVLELASAAVVEGERGCCMIESSSGQLNRWLARSRSDLRMMVTATREGSYPYAGVPWFSAPFGRDGIITALQALWMDPSLAKGVLSFLSAHQATAIDAARDAEPGKILHEARGGEMAALGEIPFGRYYGSVDATPLFVILAGQYLRRTGDLDFVAAIWSNVERALAWIEEYGDRDGDGFVEYQRQTPEGLVQQGWKDSNDSVFHADGQLASAPIALCEAQGYVHAAWRNAARVATALDRHDRAAELTRKMAMLRSRFEAAFWCEELGTYALALDGHKRPCRVRTSNAGHCLFTGIATPEHARRVARTLLDARSFSGFGIRTVAEGEACYNPMSYHNGSVWPHDNALIADGFARYGLKHAAVQLMMALFQVSLFSEDQRLPELWCGFSRQEGKGPTNYPVACSPQAWAAGSVFLLLRACLGLTIDAAKAKVRLDHPALPGFISELAIRDLSVGQGTVDLMLHRYPDGIGVNVLRRDPGIEVIVVT